MAKLHIGLSGFAYKEWQGEDLFYPVGLKQAGYLEYYASRFETVESDGTWYQMPGEAMLNKWIANTPEHFLFTPKMHRQVTHYARLKPEAYEPAGVFLKKLEPLEKAGRLGAMLVQLPPNLKRDDERLSKFLEAMPKRPSLRWSVEFRNETWHAPEVEDILRAHDVAWVGWDIDDSAAQRRDTANHYYFRMRRSEYTDDRLKEWAAYFRSKVDEGKDCFVYCKHQDAEAPWKWADRLLEFF